MTDSPMRHLLGSEGRDPGCAAGFEQLDEFCEALARGEDVSRRFAGLLNHIQNCDACREDTEGLLAALRTIADG